MVPARTDDDGGFTLVEIVVAIVLAGILAAVVVLGVGSLTSRGASASCSASADAARAASSAHWATNGSQATTFTELTSSGALAPPAGGDVSDAAIRTDSWVLEITPGSSGAPPRFSCFTGSEPGALDLVEDVASVSPTAVYSLRRMSQGYDGPLVRVRRNSDDAEADIGFDLTGKLDTTALLAFVGSDSGFVTTWYDQSGNARHATQSDRSTQPRLVDTGVVKLENGRPALALSGAQALSLPTSVTTVGNAPSTINAVGRRSGTSSTGWNVLVGYGSPTLAASRGIAMQGTTLAGHLYGVNIFGGSAIAPFVGTAVYQSTGFSWFHNGQLSGSNSTAPSTVSGVAWIGKQVNDREFWPGTVSEVVLTGDALTTAQRQALERSQGSFYGIAVG